VNYKYATNTEEPHLGGNILQGDAWTHCPNVWNYVIDRFAVKSVLDLGCGLGYSSLYFKRKGLDVLAVDGMLDNVKNSIYPSLLCDLTKGPVITKVDLVHCHEVVEHIEEQYLDNLLTSLSCGKFILMTNALPGQGGYHHVNEQPTEYWIEHLKKYGYDFLEEDSMRVRRIAEHNDGAVWMSKTGSIFSNRNF
jgi:SAM-dependent methyltransferase